MQKESYIYIIIFLIGLILGSLWLRWSNAKDQPRREAAEMYATCVQESYGMQPYEYHAEFGEYPVCQVTYANNK